MLPEAKVTIYLQVANYLKPKLRFFLRTDFTVADKHEKMRGSKISHPAIYRGNRDSVCRTEDKISGSKKMETTVKSYHQAIYLPCLWEFFLSFFLSFTCSDTGSFICDKMDGQSPLFYGDPSSVAQRNSSAGDSKRIRDRQGCASTCTVTSELHVTMGASSFRGPP